MKLTTMIERLGPVLATEIYERFYETHVPQPSVLTKADVNGIKQFLRGKSVMWARISQIQPGSVRQQVKIGFIDLKKLKHFC